MQDYHYLIAIIANSARILHQHELKKYPDLVEDCYQRCENTIMQVRLKKKVYLLEPNDVLNVSSSLSVPVIPQFTSLLAQEVLPFQILERTETASLILYQDAVRAWLTAL